MSDDIEKSLKALQKQVVIGRSGLSEAEKDDLIRLIGGPRTAENIRKALRNYSKERIPFLFSSLDTQLVADVMENEMAEAIARALSLKKSAKDLKKSGD